jgi:hypothetical protein
VDSEIWFAGRHGGCIFGPADVFHIHVDCVWDFAGTIFGLSRIAVDACCYCHRLHRIHLFSVLIKEHAAIHLFYKFHSNIIFYATSILFSNLKSHSLVSPLLTSHLAVGFRTFVIDMHQESCQLRWHPRAHWWLCWGWHVIIVVISHVRYEPQMSTVFLIIHLEWSVGALAGKGIWIKEWIILGIYNIGWHVNVVNVLERRRLFIVFQVILEAITRCNKRILKFADDFGSETSFNVKRHFVSSEIFILVLCFLLQRCEKISVIDSSIKGSSLKFGTALYHIKWAGTDGCSVNIVFCL